MGTRRQMATQAERIATLEQAQDTGEKTLGEIKTLTQGIANDLGELKTSHAEHLQAHRTTRRIATGILGAAMFLAALFGLTK